MQDNYEVLSPTAGIRVQLSPAARTWVQLSPNAGYSESYRRDLGTAES